jgi:hypothetical protein
MLNPPGYLHNATPAVATGQMDRLISIMSHVAANASGLTVMEGVRGYTDMQVTANGTPNMSVNVAAGVAIIDGTQNASQGAYVAINGGTVNLTISPANATNPRHDLIVCRVYDSQYSGSTDTSTLEVIAGTAAVTPSDPAVPANSLVLARILIAANDTAINTGDIADRRTFAAGLGGIVPVLSATQRDALAKRPGLAVYRIDTQTLEIWNATTSSWNSESSTSGSSGITAATGWSITSQTWNLKRGIFTFYMALTRTGADVAAASDGNIANVSVATIPAGQRPLQEVGIQSGRTGRLVLGTVTAAGDMRITTSVPNVSIGNGGQISLTGSWAV